MSTNLVLYAVNGAARRAVFSCDDPKDPKSHLDARLKFLVKAGAVMSESERSGSEHPEFVAVRETRESDEGGQFVMRATFEQLDPLTLDVVRTCATLAEVFKKPDALAQAQTPEDAATAAKRALSKQLSE